MKPFLGENYILSILKTSVLLLALMSFFRLAMYFMYTPYATIPKALINEWIYAMWYGIRLDLSVLGYVSSIAFIMLGILRLAKLADIKIQIIFTLYYFIIGILISAALASDIAFFSYFGEHINLMIFGVFDDDTKALLEIAWKNYNLPLILVGIMIYLILLWFIIRRFFRIGQKSSSAEASSPIANFIMFFLLIVGSFLAARGSFGHFPISKYIADVSSDPFINQLPQNGVFAFSKAYSNYKKSKSEKYDLIAMMGYGEGNLSKAFAIHTNDPHLNRQDLVASLYRKSEKNVFLEKNPPNVVVIMVESFGMPITQYQSKTFDILGRLRKHFSEDILFTNFISGSNGTISSMEPFLLNIAARPESTSFGQGSMSQTRFLQASAKVYQSKGYETSFVYGGDLSWRNVGNFMKLQGFDRVEGKGAILNAMHLEDKKSSHSWGIFDQYAYDFLLQKLQNSKKPQFIYLMTTNNHPPYEIPSDYQSRPLQWSDELSKHMKGDRTLLEKRLHDYGYALDMAGRFMDEIKKDPRYANTVVVITADNNTIESAMNYANPVEMSKKIPFYLYLPASLHPPKIDTTLPGSHKDIFPTLYHLTLSDAQYISIGTNLLDESQIHCGFNDAGIIATKNGFFIIDKPQNRVQEQCNEYYKATLAVEEHLIQTQMKNKSKRKT